MTVKSAAKESGGQNTGKDEELRVECCVCLEVPPYAGGDGAAAGQLHSCGNCDCLVCAGCLGSLSRCPVCKRTSRQFRRNRWAEKMARVVGHLP